MNKKKAIHCVIDIFCMLLLIFVDQATKYLCVTHLSENKSLPLIKGILDLHYLKNKGAAFGILQNQQLLFLLISGIVLLIVMYLLVKLPLKKKFIICRIFLVMICAGALGNMIDRMRYQYVIDFIYFSVIHFPVFNVADVYVTISTIGLILLFLFKYKEDDFSFISFKTKKFREFEDMK